MFGAGAKPDQGNENTIRDQSDRGRRNRHCL